MPPLKYHVLKEYANGVMDEKGRFFPYQFAVATVPAKLHIRYYVKSVSITATNDGAQATHITGVKADVGSQVQEYIAKVTNAANTVGVEGVSSSNNHFALGFLCKTNTPLTVVDTNITSAVNITYAEVFEAEGEYSG